MRESVSGILVIVLLVSSLPLALMPAVAQSSVPSTAGEIEEVARAVLAKEILLYLRAKYLGEDIDCLSSGELRESASYYPQYPRQITDSANRTVIIYKPIKRIVTMSTESIEMIRTLKATDKVVGVSKYVVEDEVFYPGFSDYPNIGTPWSIDYEVLLECNPDVVFTYTKWPEPAYLEEKLKGTDIKVIRFDFNKPSNFVVEVKKLGYILDKKKEAEKFIKFYSNYMKEIRESVEMEDKPRVYLEADFGSGKKYYTCGEGHGHHEMLVLAGGNNIFADVTYGKEISVEEVVRRDPEIIVKYKWPDGGFNKDTKELEEVREEILGRPELQDVTAVKNKEVYVFTWYTTRGAARYFLGIGYLAKWFHPKSFNLDPKEIYREYLTEFQGLDIDLDKSAFVYPEEPICDGTNE